MGWVTEVGAVGGRELRRTGTVIRGFRLWSEPPCREERAFGA